MMTLIIVINLINGQMSSVLAEIKLEPLLTQDPFECSKWWLFELIQRITDPMIEEMRLYLQSIESAKIKKIKNHMSIPEFAHAFIFIKKNQKWIHKKYVAVTEICRQIIKLGSVFQTEHNLHVNLKKAFNLLDLQVMLQEMKKKEIYLSKYAFSSNLTQDLKVFLSSITQYHLEIINQYLEKEKGNYQADLLIDKNDRHRFEIFLIIKYLKKYQKDLTRQKRTINNVSQKIIKAGLKRHFGFIVQRIEILVSQDINYLINQFILKEKFIDLEQIAPILKNNWKAEFGNCQKGVKHESLSTDVTLSYQKEDAFLIPNIQQAQIYEKERKNCYKPLIVNDPLKTRKWWLIKLMEKITPDLLQEMELFLQNYDSSSYKRHKKNDLTIYETVFVLVHLKKNEKKYTKHYVAIMQICRQLISEGNIPQQVYAMRQNLVKMFQKLNFQTLIEEMRQNEQLYLSKYAFNENLKEKLGLFLSTITQAHLHEMLLFVTSNRQRYETSIHESRQQLFPYENIVTLIYLKEYQNEILNKNVSIHNIVTKIIKSGIRKSEHSLILRIEQFIQYDINKLLKEQITDKICNDMSLKEEDIAKIFESDRSKTECDKSQAEGLTQTCQPLPKKHTFSKIEYRETKRIKKEKKKDQIFESILPSNDPNEIFFEDDMNEEEERRKAYLNNVYRSPISMFYDILAAKKEEGRIEEGQTVWNILDDKILLDPQIQFDKPRYERMMTLLLQTKTPKMIEERCKELKVHFNLFEVERLFEQIKK